MIDPNLAYSLAQESAIAQHDATCTGREAVRRERSRFAVGTVERFAMPVTMLDDPQHQGHAMEHPLSKTGLDGQGYTSEAQTHDAVNHPAHYTAGGVECIDALAAATVNLSGIEAVCTANAIKYLWRWKQKGGHEDLRKARWYINRILGEQP